MPEGLEAEIWTRSAQTLAGRTIDRVWFDERVAPPDLGDLLTGRRIDGVRRRGKIMLVDTDGPTLGLHFGMTGRVEVDGAAPIAQLEYASGADRDEWDRLRLHTGSTATSFRVGDDVVALRMNDPRRLGRLSIDPDLERLGPEAITLTKAELTSALHRRSAAIKSVLLDQTVVAGLGNLCVDEVLFWAGIAPTRPADEMSGDDCSQLAGMCRERLGAMLAAGGSTHGVLDPSVRAGLPACPRDGSPMIRSSIGGRTAVWCPEHQA